jgi:poly-gamma-glutamate synthesis protein (capsule biosynthesis protein)
MEVVGKGRVIVFAFGSPTSGVPRDWAASATKPGVNWLEDLSDRSVSRIAESVQAVKRPRDIVVVSIHWGWNWGYDIPREQRQFAHRLIDEAEVDVIHGHSSHHPKGIEVYRDRPIIFGGGDLLNDYEGIGGYEEYRGDLAMLYFVSMEPSTGRLGRFDLTPLQIRHFRLNRAKKEDAAWLRQTLTREGKPLGSRVELGKNQAMSLHWT